MARTARDRRAAAVVERHDVPRLLEACRCAMYGGRGATVRSVGVLNRPCAPTLVTVNGRGRASRRPCRRHVVEALVGELKPAWHGAQRALPKKERGGRAGRRRRGAPRRPRGSDRTARFRKDHPLVGSDRLGPRPRRPTSVSNRGGKLLLVAADRAGFFTSSWVTGRRPLRPGPPASARYLPTAAPPEQAVTTVREYAARLRRSARRTAAGRPTRDRGLAAHAPTVPLRDQRLSQKSCLPRRSFSAVSGFVVGDPRCLLCRPSGSRSTNPTPRRRTWLKAITRASHE